MKIIADKLQFPEGPIYCSDGSILLVEIRKGSLTRVLPDGRKTVVAKCGGGPNGAAVGPDGSIYICNNGGFEWHQTDNDIWLPGKQANDYLGGSIQKVDLETGRVETLYVECNGHPLRGPNDIVFDNDGGFWFTDTGKDRERERDFGGVYYARMDGTFINEVSFPFLGGPNGIGLSPDHTRLYMSETYTGRVYYWDLAAPGKAIQNRRLSHGANYLCTIENAYAIDSMAIDGEGNLCIATIGYSDGGITIVNLSGEQRFISMGDFMTTNICFGGESLDKAYITRSYSGSIVEVDWDNSGLPLAFNI